MASVSTLKLMVAVVWPGARLPALLCSGLGFGFILNTLHSFNKYSKVIVARDCSHAYKV